MSEVQPREITYMYPVQTGTTKILLCTTVFYAYGTMISASTSGAGKCHLTPPCKMSRVR